MSSWLKGVLMILDKEKKFDNSAELHNFFKMMVRQLLDYELQQGKIK